MPWIVTFVISILLGCHTTYCHSTSQPVSEYVQVDNQQPPCVIVIFGATGDLTARKLLPALYNLAYEHQLSDQTAIVGFSRGEYTHQAFRAKMAQAVDQFSRTKPRDLAFWKNFETKIFYQEADFENDENYENLKKFLEQIDQERGTQGNRIYYLATHPLYFPLIIEKLSSHQLLKEAKDSKDPWTRVMIEKPFGYDLNSALHLQRQLSKYLEESQTYRIDHYLCKEGVQNLMAFRFNNALFEPLWNKDYIDHVQITLGEEIGIGSRGRFWEETGALRDLFQNHLMQLLAIVAMEPPADHHPASIHREKIKILQAIRPFSSARMNEEVIRGQYAPGIVRGSDVKGYREEEDVANTSSAETFVAAKLWIDHPRWEGVAFYIRAGKRLAKQTTEIAITFKKKPSSVSQEANVLFIRIQPQAGIFLKTFSKVPGCDQELKPVVFGYQPDEFFAQSSPEAYERILYECIKGDDRLFVQVEEQLVAWRLLTPVLEYWKTEESKNLATYPAGTWGPDAADQLLLKQGHQWQLLENELLIGIQKRDFK